MEDDLAIDGFQLKKFIDSKISFLFFYLVDSNDLLLQGQKSKDEQSFKSTLDQEALFLKDPKQFLLNSSKFVTENLMMQDIESQSQNHPIVVLCKNGALSFQVAKKT